MLKAAFVQTIKRYWPFLLGANLAFGLSDYLREGALNVPMMGVTLLVSVAAILLVALPLTWQRMKKMPAKPKGLTNE